MKRAFNLVRKKRWPVRKAAKICGVPEPSLRRFVRKGKDKIDCPMGKQPIIPKQHEEKLKDHIIHLAKLGFPMSRSDVIKLATNTAVFLAIKANDGKMFTKNWLDRFLNRWPELKVVKPLKLSLRRAKATSEETVSNYFKELNQIMNKYNLKENPQLIFNVDESGFQVEHNPHRVVAPRGMKVNSIVTDRGAMTTVLAAGSAIGQPVPPFFIFKGKRMNDMLKNGAVPGSGFSMSDSGWSNSQIFKNYLENHFSKFLPNRASDEHVLLLYDGHSSHISMELINYAHTKNIILFVLPPHTSHILQPMDVTMFGPLKTFYHQECQKFMRENPGQGITRYHICELISKAFLKSFTPANLVTSFRKTGIYPVEPDAVSKLHFIPAEHLNVANQNKSRNKIAADTNHSRDDDDRLDAFLKDKISTPKPPKNTKRKYKYRPGGVAITEDRIVLKIRKVIEESKGPSNTTANRDHSRESPKPGQSNKSPLEVTSRKPSQPQNDSDSSQECSNDVCCVCKRFSPPTLRDFLRREVKFVNWGQCEHCTHWTHLEFCVPETKGSIETGKTFLCPHCLQEE
ncbi:uncharacterized protein [Apostichopus japonicus]|uniref:uncharacterized protein n=1 Tax=Stichopus japonicus TaxID=307972 RepID=UPI003AB1CE3E